MITYKTKEELLKEIQEKKAYPEMSHKFNIFEAQKNLIHSVRELVTIKFNTGRYQQNDIDEVASNLIELFNYLKEMIREKMDELGNTIEHKKIFDDLVKLERGQFKMDNKEMPLRLLNYKDFLLEYMYLVKFTNLFRGEEDVFKKLENEY